MTTLDELIQKLSKVPGLGRKSARRIAYYFLSKDAEVSQSLGRLLLELKEKVHFCEECGNFTEGKLCDICLDPSRDRTTLCVVEQAQDINVIETSHEFRGLYHVLHGVLAPLDGVGPENLNIGQLVHRVKRGDVKVKELILATNPTLEGDTTALYLKQLFVQEEMTISRLALGIPVGGDLEYIDRLTLARSLRARTRL